MWTSLKPVPGLILLSSIAVAGIAFVGTWGISPTFIALFIGLQANFVRATKMMREPSILIERATAFSAKTILCVGKAGLGFRLYRNHLIHLIEKPALLRIFQACS